MDKAESKYNPDAGISKEDEERYQKLLCENEDLQRLIVQVSFFTQLLCVVHSEEYITFFSWDSSYHSFVKCKKL